MLWQTDKKNHFQFCKNVYALLFYLIILTCRPKMIFSTRTTVWVFAKICSWKETYKKAKLWTKNNEDQFKKKIHICHILNWLEINRQHIWELQVSGGDSELCLTQYLLQVFIFLSLLVYYTLIIIYRAELPLILIVIDLLKKIYRSRRW